MKRFFRWTGIAILFCLLICFIVWFAQKATHQHIILRLSGSFFPSVVHIEKNDSLRFINLTQRPMWPAAGPHPTHTSYPDFDPKEPIAPLHSWTFTFAKEGGFAFHDHFAPETTGIVISGSQNDISNVTDESTCAAISDAQEQSGCMEIYFRNVTNKETFPKALAIFRDIAVRYPSGCHTFAHDLGKNAYKAYLENNLPDIGEETSSCSFGFWHGFTTAMQAERGFGASKEFCESITAGATDEIKSANRINCYHGIGIGLIPDPPAPNLWGAFQPLVNSALAFCNTIQGDSPYYKEHCMTGVFHATSDYMVQKLYGFSFDENSLANCSKQLPEYQETCFITLVSAVPAFTKFNLKQTLTIIQNSVPLDLFPTVFINAAIIFVDASAPLEKTGNFVEQCGELNTDLRHLCIFAVINKLYNNGTLGTEYIKAIAFCSSPWIHTMEQDDCFNEVMTYAKDSYATEKITKVCNALPEANRSRIKEC